MIYWFVLTIWVQHATEGCSQLQNNNAFSLRLKLDEYSKTLWFSAFEFTSSKWTWTHQWIGRVWLSDTSDFHIFKETLMRNIDAKTVQSRDSFWILLIVQFLHVPPTVLEVQLLSLKLPNRNSPHCSISSKWQFIPPNSKHQQI